jgi:hypothetical protein
MNAKLNWPVLLPVLVTVSGTIGTAYFNPAFLAMHPVAFAVLNAAAMILHSALPSIFTSVNAGKK